MEDYTEQDIELARLRVDNELNKLSFRNYYVNVNKELVIKGIQSRLILSEDEQEKIVNELHNLTIKKSLGEEINCLEKIALQLMFEGTFSTDGSVLIYI